MNGARTLSNMAHLSSAALRVTFRQSDALDNDLILARQGAQDNAGLALVLACYDLYGISFFDVHINIVRRLQARARR